MQTSHPSHLLQLFQRDNQGLPKPARNVFSPAALGSALGLLHTGYAQCTSPRVSPGCTLVNCQLNLNWLLSMRSSNSGAPHPLSLSFLFRWGATGRGKLIPCNFILSVTTQNLLRCLEERRRRLISKSILCSRFTTTDRYSTTLPSFVNRTLRYLNSSTRGSNSSLTWNGHFTYFQLRTTASDYEVLILIPVISHWPSKCWRSPSDEASI